MNKTTIARLLPFALLAMASGSASAAGFQLLEQNASGIGNAYAGSAAVAENASTIYFNPAGMTQLKEREISMGLAAVRPSFEFKNKGSTMLNTPALPTSGGDGSDAGSWGAIPDAYLSWALTKDLYAGVGFGAPFGLATEYDNDWVGRAQALKFDLKTINVNPSIAYRINDKVSIGGGVSWQRLEATYTRVATVLPVTSPLVGALNATKAKLDVDSDAWGWNVGALFTLSPAMKLGLSYRSSIKHEADGDITATGPSALVNAANTSKAKIDVELPDTFIVSVSQKLDDRWEMLGDLSRTGWSSIKKVDIKRTSGSQAGTTAQTLDTDFRDTWRIALGMNYRLNDAWKLKFGFAWDQTPVKDKQSRLVSLPDNDRTWLTFGGQWKVSKSNTLDLGVAYLYVPDTKIDNDQTAAGRGHVRGEYESNVWILGAQYSMAF
ncbi:MAG TPA: outer membrane protein transport protein [Aromatoleum sp.]|uniref:OmpP1/FadL family transporter n=1 Tax=Aromatoleum sp. TaxID=2307007 RepID=UPI002B4683AD|nr:outer membrane protein transport protein [Aromatoleum sp.]HJV25265.1 outer membrane protein transport protein [Aromatoleum sp.]